ncbi:MAG: OmpA family protein [Paludibacter sp.]
MKTKNLLLAALMVSFQFLNAQTKEKPISLSLNLGKNEYNGEYGNGIFDFKKPAYLFGGLTITAFVSNSFDAGLEGNYGHYGYEKDATNRFIGDKYDAYMFINYKLNNGYLLSKTSKLSPFLTAGIGLAGYEKIGETTYRTNPSPTDLLVPIGAGLKYHISDNVALQYKFVYGITNHDMHDNFKLDDKNEVFAEHILSIAFSFGAPKDADKDGIPDKLDKCPDTPAKVKVNMYGCPIDSDNDGVPDYLDKCPNEAGLAKFDGCPDTDNDGVPDSKDNCPNTPANVKVDANGCPIDSDKDGVPDYLDKCPKVFGLSKFDGCPDTDNDGVPDYLDKCPTLAGLVKFDGCPDRDNDGVPDYLDKCPDVPGIAANKGCPEVKAATLKIFTQALQGIQFESGKDVIKKSSNGILDQVVKVMKENPSYNLEINGHTDNVGDNAKNLELSQKRADAVKKYLTDKGISASRLMSKGYGETVPVSDNKTAEGKAKNRRVEFKVNF